MKTIIVTGAAGNLGSAVTRKFLEEGFRVVGTVRPGSANDEKIKNEYYTSVPVDLRDEASVRKFLSEVIASHGCPSLAIMTTGGFATGSIGETSVKDLLAQYELNFLTNYPLAKELLSEMKKAGRGNIYITGARTGSDMKYSKGMTAYGLAKSLVFRMVELMNVEAGKNGVQSIVIVPTTIDTPQNRAAMPDADYNKWTKPGAIADMIFRHYAEQSPSTLLEV